VAARLSFLDELDLISTGSITDVLISTGSITDN